MTAPIDVVVTSAQRPPDAAARVTVVLAVAATVAVSLPVFLLGALIVEIRNELNVPIWGLGLLVAVFWGAAALAASRAGDLDDRLGSTRLALLSLVAAVVSMVGMAVITPDWLLFLPWVVIGGFANGVQHPATNSLITARVPLRRRGFAFGLKQAAVPLATVLAGLAIPGVALVLGWRWAFVFGAIDAGLTVVLYLALSRGDVHRKRAELPELPSELRRFFLTLAVMTFAGGATVTACTAYLVSGAIERDFSPTLAGLLLSASSVVGAINRGVVGLVVDRRGQSALQLSASLILVGGLGAVLIAFGGAPLFALGAFLAAGLSGGWAGLVHYFVSRNAGPLTSRATGITQTGSFIGCAVGPVLFGVAAGIDSRMLPWLLMGAIAVVGAAVGFALSRRRPTPVTDVV